MKQFDKVTIIGVGLIGGSIGLALKKKKMAKEVIGVCRHQRSLNKARQMGAIDQGSLDYKHAVQGADLVILAAPVSQIIRIGEEIAPYLKDGSLLTDAGSTKLEIVRRMEKVMPQGVSFVGAHPLAGSEKRGVGQARADLFKGAICILARGKKTAPGALKAAAGFWKKIGCRTVVLTPEAHDATVALISHLPHLAAAQLVKTGKGSLNFAASGFLDTTRIASSDAEVWSDICLTNKKFIIKAIDEYINNLKLVRGLIFRGQKQKLSSGFKRAKSLRDALSK